MRDGDKVETENTLFHVSAWMAAAKGRSCLGKHSPASRSALPVVGYDEGYD